mmetsp:Transcript_8746/g.26192  ORF Transcript_8746/g.26192 Transcript_8746/m.26192 type:complete len:346 (-) Transcript_8746:274-1311(-)
MARLFYSIFYLAAGHALVGTGALAPPSSPKNQRHAFNTPVGRREALVAAGGAIAGTGIMPVPNADAAGSPAPVAVIGAGGRTGALCVASCLRRGVPVRALTRSGTWQPPATDVIAQGREAAASYSGSLLSVAPCDVKDVAALASGVSGCRAVIYAASASKKGGSAKEIDNVGVVSAGDACLRAGVGRYVVISSTAATRPKSLGYVFTNVFGGIMDEKRRGEEGVVTAYSKTDPATSTYIIIRPGGLEEPKLNAILGPSSLELSQGDALAGIVSRADLAEASVEAALSSASNLRDSSFELYYADSAQPCEGRFKPLLENGMVARLQGETYETLFSGIKPDGEYYVP